MALRRSGVRIPLGPLNLDPPNLASGGLLSWIELRVFSRVVRALNGLQSTAPMWSWDSRLTCPRYLHLQESDFLIGAALQAHGGKRLSVLISPLP